MVRHSALKGLYETERTIGCGGFAKVKLATHLATGEKVAIKIMDKTLLGDDVHRVTLELEALKTLCHENICQLYQVIETESHFFIVMEYCSGGELFDHIVEKNRLTEAESRMFFRQIASAVAYIHSLGYAHRDLKPENVLLDKSQNLKLIDFGLCAKPIGGMDSFLFTSCGSPTYAAPELILGQQYLGQEVDVWAMGVLLYALLCGSLPFDDLNIDNLYRKIVTTDILIRGDGSIIVFGVHNHYRLELPQKLMSKLAPEEFRNTVGKINKLLDNQMSLNFMCFLGGCFCCPFSAGISLAPSLLINRRTKKKIRKLLEKENKRIYNYLGLTWSLVKEKFGLTIEYCLKIDFVKRPHNGKYAEPTFISNESKKLIRSMLQVDPKKRIKVGDLLDHPWLTLGVLEPVQVKMKNSAELDRNCLEVMAKFIDVDERSVRNELNKWKYDYNTVTYLLLLAKKKRGQTLKLNSAYGWKFVKTANEQLPMPLIELPVNQHLTPHHPSRFRRKFGNVPRSPGYLSPSPTVVERYQTEMCSPSRQFLEPTTSSSRKAHKRARSPILDEASPVPMKKATPGKGETPSKTPDRRKLVNGAAETTGSARRMLGSIERSLHKVRHVLTPKKGLDLLPGSPAILNSKDLCNVSTTQCKDPELVIVELSKGLEKKGIICARKGFTLKGSLEPNTIHRLGGCSFELEICFLPNLSLPSTRTKVTNLTPTKSILKQGVLNKEIFSDILKDSSDTAANDRKKQKGYVGIRRKRLKGDSWCYKKVCEQVLALTCTGFNNGHKGGLLESSV